MTFLPIVRRELAVASRRAGSYWTRTLIGGAAVLVGAWFFGFSAGQQPEEIARSMFIGLSLVGLVYALLAGRRFTADCLSSEKREGTLGLLFLTDLKGYDVVFGKLAATSLSGFFGLLAIVPVLALPMLLGGVSLAQVCRMALVLANTFWLSLAVGIFVSALTRDARKAFGANFVALLSIIAAPPMLAGIIYLTTPSSSPLRDWMPALMYSCPAYGGWLCVAPASLARPEDYWWSFGVLHMLAWALVMLTSLIVPRAWQDRPAGVKWLQWKEWCSRWGYGDGTTRLSYRKRLLDVNAFYWLAARLRIKPALVWGFLGFMVIWWLYVSVKSGSALMYEGLIATALILNSTFKLWVTVETGQRLGEDQSSGALELLLSTRLSVPEIIRGQRLALQRQFLWPLVAVILVEAFFTGALMKRFNAEASRMFLTGAGGIFMLLTDIAALIWVTMSACLTSRNANVAIIKTLTRILFLPWLLVGVGVVLGMVLWELTGSNELDWRFYLSLWFLGGILTDVGFGLVAWTKVRTMFRQLALPAGL